MKTLNPLNPMALESAEGGHPQKLHRDFVLDELPAGEATPPPLAAIVPASSDGEF